MSPQNRATPLLLTRNSPAAALEPEDLHRGEALGERLRQELTSLLMGVPRSGASALSLSRDLKLDRNLCHRVCSALEERQSGLEVLSRLPGPESLMTFITASAKRAADPVKRDAARAACEQFRRFILDVAGTQTRLNARLLASRGHAAAQSERGEQGTGTSDGQVAVFDAARRVMGAWSQGFVSINVMRPGEEPGKMEYVSLSGYVGLHTERAPFPITPVSSSMNLGPSGTTIGPDGTITPVEASAGLPPGLVPEFSSSPLPTIQVRPESGRMMYVIEPGEADRSLDLFFLSRAVAEDPRRTEPYLQTFYRRVRTATKVLVMDAYVHRSVRMTGSVWVRALHAQLGMSRDPRQGWHERLPGELRVELLGSGIDAVATPAWERHGAAVARTFAAGGWDPDEFIGYRCQAAYPYWGASYLLDFELERA